MSWLNPNNKKDRELVQSVWDSFEENEPDISTERLIAMTADTLVIDYGDVLDFLIPND